MGPDSLSGHPDQPYNNSSTTSPTSLQPTSEQQGSQPEHLQHAGRPSSTPSVIKSSPTSPTTTTTKIPVPVQVRTSPGCPLHGRDRCGSTRAPRGRRSQDKVAAIQFDPPPPLCGLATSNSTEISPGRLQLTTATPTSTISVEIDPSSILQRQRSQNEAIEHSKHSTNCQTVWIDD